VIVLPYLLIAIELVGVLIAIPFAFRAFRRHRAAGAWLRREP